MPRHKGCTSSTASLRRASDYTSALSSIPFFLFFPFLPLILLLSLSSLLLLSLFLKSLQYVFFFFAYLYDDERTEAGKWDEWTDYYTRGFCHAAREYTHMELETG